jgi:hypothetical protein
MLKDSHRNKHDIINLLHAAATYSFLVFLTVYHKLLLVCVCLPAEPALVRL